MAQYTEKDSAGAEHVLWSQEWGSSCGAATCYMIVCSVRQQTLGGGEGFMRLLATRHGATIFDLFDGPGINAGQIAAVLTDNGLRVDSRQYAQAEYNAMVLVASESKPLALHVAWRNLAGQRTGGHWVVCVGVNGADAIILDPWYGLSEVPIAALPEYNPDHKGQSVLSNNGFSGWFVRVL